MKRWNLESPAVAWLLHAGLFAAVSAVVWFGERTAPQVPTRPASVQWRVATPVPPMVERRLHAAPALPSAERSGAVLRAGCVVLPSLYELSFACVP